MRLLQAFYALLTHPPRHRGRLTIVGKGELMYRVRFVVAALVAAGIVTTGAAAWAAHGSVVQSSGDSVPQGNVPGARSPGSDGSPGGELKNEWPFTRPLVQRTWLGITVPARDEPVIQGESKNELPFTRRVVS
jgi:hypothetical protein